MLEQEKRIATLTAARLPDLPDVVIATDERLGGLQAQHGGKTATLSRANIRKMLRADNEEQVADLWARQVREWVRDQGTPG